MTIEDMRMAMRWSNEQCPTDALEQLVTQIENSKAIDGAGRTSVPASLFGPGKQLERALLLQKQRALNTFYRNFELTKLQQKDIGWDCKGPAPYFIPHFSVNLTNRKGWQRKGEHDLEGNYYEIYEQTKTPEICMYSHLRAYVKYLEKVVLRRSMEPDEYIFPRVGSNGIYYFKQEMTYDTVQKLLAKLSKEAGLSERHSSHCLRRGGAKYRFLEAPLGERWSLGIIRWWGGWAEGESVDTLIRYLLDDLTRCEKSHKDALCPIPRRTDLSFNGDHVLTNPITGVESRELKLSIDRKMDDMAEKVGAHFTHALSQLSMSLIISGGSLSLPSPSSEASESGMGSQLSPSPFSPLHSTQSTPASSTGNSPTTTTPPSGHLPVIQAAGARGGVETPPLAGVCIADLPKGSNAWRVALEQWESPTEGTSNIALKDWPQAWFTKDMKVKTAAK
ncbi:hypothetical protein BJ138DRAFT_1201457, partial [Hygrophoropsis aurantiaca]